MIQSVIGRWKIERLILSGQMDLFLDRGWEDQFLDGLQKY